MAAPMGRLRLAELLGALSLATDLDFVDLTSSVYENAANLSIEEDLRQYTVARSRNYAPVIRSTCASRPPASRTSSV